MILTLLMLVQWLHILAGIAWFGGYIFIDLVIWPTLLRLPAAQAQATSDMIGRFAGPVMGTSGSLVVLLGIVRGTLLGPIKSLGFLFSTPYGFTWLVALAVALVLTFWGATWHERWLGPVWEDGRVRPGAVRRIWVGTIFELACFGIVLACMVLMGIGL